MPEVIRGIRSESQPCSPSSSHPDPRVTFERNDSSRNPLTPTGSRRSGRKSSQHRRDRPESDAYYDSRAASKREFKRRASTLQDYYAQHPYLLPQLPFTFRHGFKRWKLAGYIALIVIDACVVPIVLYYAMTFAGNVQGYIVFAIVATIWGGPTYVEFAVRSWRLISKKADFFKPLGVTTRWGFDVTNWILVITIAAVTALLVVGSSPHIVFLRVLSMPGPAILFCIGGSVFLITLYSLAGWKAPFMISSTVKGGKVHPGVYYIVEDIVAVNAGGGRPFREGLAARYDASPIFRKMIRDQSLFWSIPSLVIAIACTVVVCIHAVPKYVAYGIGWGVPFLWAGIWAAISVPWVRRELHRERAMWEEDNEKTVMPVPLGRTTPPSAQANPDFKPTSFGSPPPVLESDPETLVSETTHELNVPKPVPPEEIPLPLGSPSKEKEELATPGPENGHVKATQP